MPTETDLQRIASGGPPADWTYTAKHPVHGEVTFTAGLPTALTLSRHSIAMDNLLAELSPNAEPRAATMLLVAAIAGLQTLVTLPVIDEARTQDPDDPARAVLRRVYYDPVAETNENFLVDVWLAFSSWRQAFVEQVDQLGNSYGETSGSDSSTESTSPTASPSTTPV